MTGATGKFICSNLSISDRSIYLLPVVKCLPVRSISCIIILLNIQTRHQFITDPLTNIGISNLNP